MYSIIDIYICKCCKKKEKECFKYKMKEYLFFLLQASMIIFYFFFIYICPILDIFFSKCLLILVHLLFIIICCITLNISINTDYYYHFIFNMLQTIELTKLNQNEVHITVNVNIHLMNIYEQILIWNLISDGGFFPFFLSFFLFVVVFVIVIVMFLICISCFSL